VIVAAGGINGAGIGGGGVYAGRNGNGGEITISGGAVTATGGNNGAGIGGGIGGASGTFYMDSDSIVFASNVSDMETNRKTGGILVIGNVIYWWHGDDYILNQNATIPIGYTLTVPSGRTFTIPTEVNLTNSDTVIPTDGSAITVSGTVSGNKINSANISVPAIYDKTQTCVTLCSVNLLAVTGQDVEYACNTVNSAPTNGWQDTPIFTGLDTNTNYYFFARAKENANFKAGTVSIGTSVTTDKMIVSVKALPTTPTSSDVTVTVTANCDCGLDAEAYSFDGGATWQAANTKTYSVNTIIAADTIQVRNNVGNIEKYGTQIIIDNIDMGGVSVSGIVRSYNPKNHRLSPKADPNLRPHQAGSAPGPATARRPVSPETIHCSPVSRCYPPQLGPLKYKYIYGYLRTLGFGDEAGRSGKG